MLHSGAAETVVDQLPHSADVERAVLDVKEVNIIEDTHAAHDIEVPGCKVVQADMDASVLLFDSQLTRRLCVFTSLAESNFDLLQSLDLGHAYPNVLECGAIAYGELACVVGIGQDRISGA